MSDGQIERVKAVQQGVEQMPTEPAEEQFEDITPADEGFETVRIEPGTPEHEAIQQAAREAGLGPVEPAPEQEKPAETGELDEIIEQMEEAGPSVDVMPTQKIDVSEIKPTDLGAIAGGVMESGEKDEFQRFYATLPESVEDSSGVSHPREELKQNIEAIRHSLNQGNLKEAGQFLQTIPRADGLRSRVRELTGLWERKRQAARKELDEAYGEQAA